MSQNDRDLDTLVQDLTRFRAVAAPSALRARVRAEIMTAPVTASAPRRSWLSALRPIVAATLVVAVLAAAGGSAAAGSLPGDPAFGIKRAVEDVQVAVTIDDTARLDVLTTQLDRRLGELEAVVAQRPSAVGVAIAEYEAALARVERQLAVVAGQASTPARDAAVARATAAAEDHIARLRALEGTLPAAAQAGIERAIDAQERIHGNDRGPASPQAPTASPGEPSSSFRPGAAPGGAPGAGQSGMPTVRPTTPPARTDRSAVPTRR
jgi:uncharacterized protein DUF5667